MTRPAPTAIDNDGDGDVRLARQRLRAARSCYGQPATITGSGTVTGTNGDDVILTGPGRGHGRRAGRQRPHLHAAAAPTPSRAAAATTASPRAAATTTCAAAPGNDRLAANGGNDDVGGQAGDDKLQGGAGDDSAQGSAGNDVVRGDAGNDRLNGGDGADRAPRRHRATTGSPAAPARRTPATARPAPTSTARGPRLRDRHRGAVSRRLGDGPRGAGRRGLRAGARARPGRVHVHKGGVHHFVPRPGDRRFAGGAVDVSALDEVLEVDVAARTLHGRAGRDVRRRRPAHAARRAAAQGRPRAAGHHARRRGGGLLGRVDVVPLRRLPRHLPGVRDRRRDGRAARAGPRRRAASRWSTAPTGRWRS